jgi:hypothetical protein
MLLVVVSMQKFLLNPTCPRQAWIWYPSILVSATGTNYEAGHSCLAYFMRIHLSPQAATRGLNERIYSPPSIKLNRQSAHHTATDSRSEIVTGNIMGLGTGAT